MNKYLHLSAKGKNNASLNILAFFLARQRFCPRILSHILLVFSILLNNSDEAVEKAEDNFLSTFDVQCRQSKQSFYKNVKIQILANLERQKLEFC